jgi:hypothetical protein
MHRGLVPTTSKLRSERTQSMLYTQTSHPLPTNTEGPIVRLFAVQHAAAQLVRCGTQKTRP